MKSSIEVARHEVQSAFERLVACVEANEPRPAVSFEAEAWTLLLALGRALMTLFFVRQVSLMAPRHRDHPFQANLIACSRQRDHPFHRT